jgi:hypothetical protein
MFVTAGVWKPSHFSGHSGGADQGRKFRMWPKRTGRRRRSLYVSTSCQHSFMRVCAPWEERRNRSTNIYSPALADVTPPQQLQSKRASGERMRPLFASPLEPAIVSRYSNVRNKM